MTPSTMLCLVLLGVYPLVTLVLSAAVALAWHAGLRQTAAGSGDLVLLRLLPAAGGALIVLAVVLPAFLTQEPHEQHEAAGPLLVVLAALSGVAFGFGIRRGWRACTGARAVLRGCDPARRWTAATGQEIHVVDIPEPLVAVIGGWRPRIVAAECVICACSAEEFQQVIAHEAAHISAHDNLKQLLLIASPDVLSWTRVGAELMERWRAAAELEADRRATGTDPRKRLALAAALVKVARALGAAEHARLALSMPIASGEVEARVRRLLAPLDSVVPGVAHTKSLLWCALLLPVAVLPFYPWVHELIEALVRLGR
jgi:hypothetical protein